MSSRPEGVVVPIRDSEESVHILPEDLPDYTTEDAADEITSVLQAELAPLHVWIELAEEYWRQGKGQLFQLVLETLMEGIKEESVKSAMQGSTEAEMHNFEDQLLRIYNMLASEAATEAIKSKQDPHRRQELADRAKAYIDRAEVIKRYAEPTLLNMGWTVLNLMDGESWKRAEYYFTNAAQTKEFRTQLLAKLGMAIMLFHLKQDQAGYRKARILFAEVIRTYPDCPASVRVGFGLCCFKLGEMERAKAAFRRALQLSPGNKEAMLGLSRTELVDADPKDYPDMLQRVVRMQAAAYKQNNFNALAANCLANYYLCTWFPLPFTVTATDDGFTFILNKGDASALTERDVVRLGDTFVARVKDVYHDSFTISRPFPRARMSSGPIKVYRKDLNKAERLADQARRHAEFNEVRAESSYIQARILHQREEYAQATEWYREACNSWPDLAPAQYGLAQMLAEEGRALLATGHHEEAQKKYDEAVSALEKVLSRFPNDPDALHLMGLLYGEQNKSSDKVQALDKLKKAVDLRPDMKDTWLALAQVHQREPADLKEAFRCQKKAEELFMQHGETVPAALYSNLGALHHVQGDAKEAKDYYLKALEAYAETGAHGVGAMETDNMDAEVAIVHPCNSTFWEWQDVDLTVKLHEGSNVADVSDPELTETLHPGDHIRIRMGSGPRDFFVTEVEGAADSNTLRLKHSYIFPPRSIDEEEDADANSNVARKASRGLLRFETLATVFNLACVHQETGDATAARELFLAIATQYPSYTAAYVKLGLMAHARGKTAEAKSYLLRAQEIDPENKDVGAICGKLEQDVGARDAAQKLFEPMNKDGDSFAMVALGSMYYANAVLIPEKAYHIQHAQVYFQKVLKKNPNNVYAAHGLALVLAETGFTQEALKVMTYIREKSPEKPEDVLINLAHLHMHHKNFNAAVHCYETFIKKRRINSDQQGRNSASNLEVKILQYLAQAEFHDKTHMKALRSILKAAHIAPSNPEVMFDVAYVLEDAAVGIFKPNKKGNPEPQAMTLQLVRRAHADLILAQSVYQRQQLIEAVPRTKERIKYLTQNIPTAARIVENEERRAQKDEEQRQQREVQVQEQQRIKEEARRKEKEDREREEERRKQEARDRQEALGKFLPQWAQEPKEPPPKKKGKKGAKEDLGLEESDEEEAAPPREGDEKEVEMSDDGASSGEEYGMKREKKGKKGGGRTGKGKAGKGEDGAGRKRKGAEKDKEAVGAASEGAKTEGAAPKKRRLKTARTEEDEDDDLMDVAPTLAPAPAPVPVPSVAAELSEPAKPAEEVQTVRRRVAVEDADDEEEAEEMPAANEGEGSAVQQSAPAPSPAKTKEQLSKELFGAGSDEDEE